jgi:hypothetical protein
VEALSVDQAFRTLAGANTVLSGSGPQSTTTKGHRENVDLSRLDSGHHTRIGAIVGLKGSTRVAKACDKPEIDLYRPVLAAIVKTWYNRTLDLKKMPTNAPKQP